MQNHQMTQQSDGQRMYDNTNTSVVSRFDSTDGLVRVSQMCSHPDLLRKKNTFF